VLSFIDDGQSLPPYPFLVGRRGYFGDTLGAVGQNDVGLYDDAIWLVERESMTAFNANCDPTRLAPGIARLLPGRWKYRPGTHGLSRPKAQQYEALVQAGHVTVSRGGGVLDTGFFGINIHCGGEHGTSSLGCQTIPPDQWGDKHRPILPSFMGHIHRALADERRTDDVLTYILTSRYA
jgi:lysozyme